MPAARTLLVIQPGDDGKPKQVSRVANTLAAFHLLDDSQDAAAADPTKTLIDNFIAGIKDKTLWRPAGGRPPVIRIASKGNRAGSA